MIRPIAGVEWNPVEAFSGDAGYQGSAVEIVETTLQLKQHISEKIKDAYAIHPINCIVERTFAWLGISGDCLKIMKFLQIPRRIWFVSL